jgi:hypothetical protein
MNHELHDPDLIAAFAGGDSHETSAAEAERLLASCAECRAEFDLHRDVAGWLASAPAVSMTAEERTAMRAGVRSGISSGASVATIAPRSMRRWTAIGSVAATLFVLVGVLGVVSQMNKGIQGSATLNTEAQTLAGESARAAADAGGSATTAAPATTAAAAETTMAAPTSGFFLSDLSAVSKQELSSQVADQIAALRSDAAAEPITAKRLNDSENPIPECFPSDQDVYAITEATIDEKLIEVFVVKDAATGDYVAEAFTADTCEPFSLA